MALRLNMHSQPHYIYIDTFVITGRQTDRQADRQTDGRTDTHTHTLFFINFAS